MNMKLQFLLLIIVSLFTYIDCKAKWRRNMKTFSHAVKAAYCAANEEIELFAYNKGPGVITEQWYTGYECLGPNTTIRYYVDDNSQPSIEMNLYMAHGIGFVSEWTKKNGADKETEQGNDIHEETIKGERVEIFHPELAYPDDPGTTPTTINY